MPNLTDFRSPAVLCQIFNCFSSLTTCFRPLKIVQSLTRTQRSFASTSVVEYLAMDFLCSFFPLLSAFNKVLSRILLWQVDPHGHAGQRFFWRWQGSTSLRNLAKELAQFAKEHFLGITRKAVLAQALLLLLAIVRPIILIFLIAE